MEKLLLFPSDCATKAPHFRPALAHLIAEPTRQYVVMNTNQGTQVNNMRENLTNEDARRLVLDGGGVQLWRIAAALDRSGPPFPENLSASLLADVLEVGEVQ
ncbi:hypothetical protein [Stigmatella aurantiaca]|uniref:hypothetical protein n=1 Tax=Stigmatella aurantiaca TaxID=41 RepID=UPI0015A506E3|nr:hypothetical protein [Stigmatella aurantiaca]